MIKSVGQVQRGLGRVVGADDTKEDVLADEASLMLGLRRKLDEAVRERELVEARQLATAVETVLTQRGLEVRAEALKVGDDTIVVAAARGGVEANWFTAGDQEPAAIVRPVWPWMTIVSMVVALGVGVAVLAHVHF